MARSGRKLEPGFAPSKRRKEMLTEHPAFFDVPR